MQHGQAILANTFANRRGEVLSKEALEMMVAQIKRNYMPINIEHDPRIPTQGRISDAYLHKRGDDEYEVVAELELFDETDTLESVKGNKEIVRRSLPDDKIVINYDRNFDNLIDSEDINRIIDKIDGRGVLSVKNAIDPIAVLEVVVLVSFGAIAKGFLSKIGGESWEYVKDGIKSLFSRKKEGEREKILLLSFRVVRNEVEFDVDVLATNPSQEEIDVLFSEGLEELDNIVLLLYQENARLHKMVFEYRKEGIVIKYAVTKDCFPLSPNIKVVDKEKL